MNDASARRPWPPRRAVYITRRLYNEHLGRGVAQLVARIVPDDGSRRFKSSSPDQRILFPATAAHTGRVPPPAFGRERWP